MFTSGLITVGVTVKLQSSVSLVSSPQAGTGNNPLGEKIRMQGSIAQQLRVCTLESGSLGGNPFPSRGLGPSQAVQLRTSDNLSEL